MEDHTPEEGELIAVIIHHHKNRGWASCEIITGEVQSTNIPGLWSINDCDDTGKGLKDYYPEIRLVLEGIRVDIDDETTTWYPDDTFEYWAYAHELPELPEEYKGEKE